MTEATTSLVCYNRGCGKSFNPAENHAEACEYHPGVPVFHDAYKGWSCCNKKCTDFTEFLNFKGCAKSLHSNLKPAEPEKPKTDPPKPEALVSEESAKLAVKPARLARPSADCPLVPLATTVASSLKQLLDKRMSEMSLGTKEAEVEEILKPGTSCKNGGCKKEYEGEHSNLDTCLHHPGVPVFHEGLKFWSCCKKRTTDFETFLEQPGCTTGDHNWLKKRKSDSERVTCRYDWHQTGNNVIISVYAKGTDPTQSTFEASPVKLRMTIAFADGLFEEELVLRGIIDTAKSAVTLFGTKVEVKLSKAEFYSWDKLNEPVLISDVEGAAQDEDNDLNATV